MQSQNLGWVGILPFHLTKLSKNASLKIEPQCLSGATVQRMHRFTLLGELQEDLTVRPLARVVWIQRLLCAFEQPGVTCKHTSGAIAVQSKDIFLCWDPLPTSISATELRIVYQASLMHPGSLPAKALDLFIFRV